MCSIPCIFSGLKDMLNQKLTLPANNFNFSTKLDKKK